MTNFFIIAGIFSAFFCSVCWARLGERVQDNPRSRDFTNAAVINDFVFGDMLTEPFVNPNPAKTFKHDPIAKVTQDVATTAPGVKSPTVVFDMIDRLQFRGIATTGSAAIKNFTAIAMWYQSQPLAFRTRYQLLPQPFAAFDAGFILSSPGMPLGQFRTETLGGLEFFEVSRFARFLTTPTCDGVPPFVARPPTAPPSTSYIYFMFVRAVKAFWKAGRTVRTLTDAHGNVFYNIAYRALAASANPGFTAGTVTLTQDEENACLYTRFAPKNKQLSESIVCKQLQVTDEFGNTYLFMRGPAAAASEEEEEDSARRLDTEDEDEDSGDEGDAPRLAFDDAFTVAGPPGTILSCQAVHFTQALTA